jgi:hypothetical protein
LEVMPRTTLSRLFLASFGNDDESEEKGIESADSPAVAEDGAETGALGGVSAAMARGAEGCAAVGAGATAAGGGGAINGVGADAEGVVAVAAPVTG